MLYQMFRNGMNIGGWLSQYEFLFSEPFDKKQMAEHLRTFITEADIARIASWGFDHVRLPVDYRALEAEEDSLTDAETAFSYMDLCADWCEKYHLNLIIDLHNAAGNVYGMWEKPMPLLTEERFRQRFISLWERVTEHFKGRKTPVMMFELLNEVTDGSGYLWERLYVKTVNTIRKIDDKRYILVGSNHANSSFALKELRLLDDEGVFYNFHFYDPQVFTHQQAHFSEEMVAFDRKIHYPGDIRDFTGFLQEHRQFLPKYSRVAMEERVDRQSMRALLKDAFDFAQYSGHELYCGELGVIETADAKDAAGWMRDCIDLLEEHQIGHALWNYKGLDFGFVNREGEVVMGDRLAYLSGRRSFE